MPKPIKLTGRQGWLTYKPPKERDLRQAGKLGKKKFWSKKAAIRERKARAKILEKGNQTDRLIADYMSKPPSPKKLAQVFCCPLVARQFQIYFTAQGLATDDALGANAILVTLFDPKRAVKRDRLHKINWRKEKATLSARLKRSLGDDVIAVGIGDVEYDEHRRCWQPHFHLAVYGASEDDMKRLRLSAYFARRGDLRPMLVSNEISMAGWFSYMSRLMPFRKLPNSKRRVRHKDPEFRRLMRYYARRDPTEFIFRHRCIFEKSSS